MNWVYNLGIAGLPSAPTLILNNTDYYERTGIFLYSYEYCSQG